ncbi:hypothetical protein T06_13530 [Trichinella sp. T6]|nr:hypothetical protein T06_13530 [Trichinella sp. T6]
MDISRPSSSSSGLVSFVCVLLVGERHRRLCAMRFDFGNHRRVNTTPVGEPVSLQSKTVSLCNISSSRLIVCFALARFFSMLFF